MFRAISELVRSWFEAEIWPIIQLASSELARASRSAAKFHYANWFRANWINSAILKILYIISGHSCMEPEALASVYMKNLSK